MHYSTTIVGLDVHKETIVTAVLPPGSKKSVEQTTLQNDSKTIERWLKRLAKREPLEFVYEAGPCGLAVHRQLTDAGFSCVVIAPGLTPQRSGDRVKTDRRDAEKLAKLHRAGELTPIWIPSREEESIRDLVRAREDALGDRMRARQRVMHFMLRQGRVFRETKSWTLAHRRWLRAQRFDWPALESTYAAYLRGVEETEFRLRDLDDKIEELAQTEPYKTPVRYLSCLKGIKTLSASTLVAEAHDLRRFKSARSFMSYVGLVPSERSSGATVRRGSITKAGNAHIRRVLVEAAWNYRCLGPLAKDLAKRRDGCPPEVVAIARRAEQRLNKKFRRVSGRGRTSQIAAVAVARELAGFIWAIGRHFPEKN